MVRPSISLTISSSCVTETVLTRMSAKAPCPEMGMPSLQKFIASLSNEANHICQFVWCEADISCNDGLL